MPFRDTSALLRNRQVSLDWPGAGRSARPASALMRQGDGAFVRQTLDPHHLRKLTNPGM